MGAWWNGEKVIALLIAATILLVAWMVRFEWADKYGFYHKNDSPELFATAPGSAGSVVSVDLSASAASRHLLLAIVSYLSLVQEK